ncbi:exonuclease domain-containing protein [Runella slithyformis]|uniref:Exonuclease RNase T and DNA polymerase III n=1 Tax=Runella slithyformis (strain ATCC 29530 / DSM 19594 / LMG 11500 / NCIMB 11436 / LSU 4) TaxID=761193 RepID=A0A7U4E439_RUNSL|nr:exonuclease domain-containing protein [Runella slithyformis]AEI46753.1 Exonuclease RNase T and DNA polymerase III [Runella slithyformis DSM 19594]
MKFIAIDFETANEARSSACALGLSLVENGQIVDSKYWLIRPEPLYVTAYNQGIHGISEDMLLNQPTFADIWPDIVDYFRDNTILAHNAAFDVGVLTALLTKYSIELPKMQYACSMRLAKGLWREYYYSLKYLAYRHKIDFIHHHAGEDARACALLTLKMIEKSGVSTIEDLCQTAQLRLRQIEQFGKSISGGKSAKTLTANNTDFDVEHPFYQKEIIFTGTLEGLLRRDAQQFVLDIGGKIGDGVTKNTNFLVVGRHDFNRYGDGFKSSKLKKAESLIDAGQDLEILGEEDFIEMIQVR